MLRFPVETVKYCKSRKYDVIDREIIKQLIRSACSIGANYIEANDSLGEKDKLMRMKIARKEARETVYWLELLNNLKDIPDNLVIDNLYNEAGELKNILSSIIIKLSSVKVIS
jgi:four helix bundle protein